MSEEDGDPGRRTEATRDQYTQRFNQLVAQARLTTAGPDGPNAAAHRVTPAALVDHLVGRKRSYAASSWRLMRASAVWGMRQQAAGETAARRREIEAAVERLKAERPDPDAERPLMTSRTKAKRLPMGDLSRIRHAAAAADTAAGSDLMLFLPAANLTGLRPAEWPSAVFRRSPRPGFKYELGVANAKHTNGRGNGSHRALYWTDLPERLVAEVSAWIEIARQPGYDARLESMAKAMTKITRSLFPRRKKWPTLYSPRHEAIARWKAHYWRDRQSRAEELHALATVAALAGHASDKTATTHYARRAKGKIGLDELPVPAAHPDQVATVRQVIRLDWKKERESRPTPKTDV
jgi:hypothetical protein